MAFKEEIMCEFMQWSVVIAANVSLKDFMVTEKNVANATQICW
jgi:hypothetical protein